MNLTTKTVNGVTVVNIEGKLDTITADEEKKAIDAIMAAGAVKILLNLEKMDFISSTGLRVVLLTAKALKKNSGELRICAMQTVVSDVFRISGFSQFLNIFDTYENAINGF